jgi:hypothetical protein
MLRTVVLPYWLTEHRLSVHENRALGNILVLKGRNTGLDKSIERVLSSFAIYIATYDGQLD